MYGERTIDVRYPWTGEVVATVPKATVEDVRRAFKTARDYKPTLTRHERYKILMKAGDLIAARLHEIARLITLESGLCIKDTLYEVGRASDVLLFAAQQALVDDGQSFSCDLTHHGKSRRVHTMREPMMGVISAITPFNADTLYLGESLLGVDWVLGPSDRFARYAFNVEVARILTARERQQLRAIVEYLKPAHTHFVDLVEPLPIVMPNHWELGLSDLGETTDLH